MASVGAAASNSTSTGTLAATLLLAHEEWQPRFILAIVPIFTFFFIFSSSRVDKPLSHVPPIGCTGDATFYLGALHFFARAQKILSKGYRSVGLFRVVYNLRWQVVVSGRSYLKDLSDAPGKVLSADAANNDRFQISHTIGSRLWDNSQVIKGLVKQLSRDLELIMVPLMDELAFVVNQRLVNNQQRGDWVSVGGLDFTMHVIRQVNTRVFVGQDKARDIKYLEAIMALPQRIVLVATVLQWVPGPLKAFFARLLSVSREFDYVAESLAPLVEARSGNDITFTSDTYETLSRIIDRGQSHGTDVNTMVFHTIMISFVAMHTSTYTLGHALLRLASMPQFAATLREEAQQVTQDHGWTTAGLKQIKKLDSFLRESARVDPLATVGANVKVMEPFKFSDGIALPTGTTVFVPLVDIHMDDNYYAHADRIDPLRFYSTETGTVVPYTTPTSEYLPWGFGKHACPGRFYATALLKSILAYLLINFEIRLPGGAREKPANFLFEANRLPNLFAKLEMRCISDVNG